jgi:hypothetical protein
MLRRVALIRTDVSEERIASIFKVTKSVNWEQSYHCVRFEVFTAVTMKNGVFKDVMPCGSCKNRRFGGT